MKNTLSILLLALAIISTTAFVAFAQNVEEITTSDTPTLYSPVTNVNNSDDNANDDDNKNGIEPIGAIADDFEVSPNEQIHSNIEIILEKPISDSSGNNGINYEKVQWIYDDDSEGDKKYINTNRIYIKTSGEVAPEVQSAITDLRIKPLEIFSPILSEVENLMISPEIVNDKVIYNLKAKDIGKPIFRTDEMIEPIFDLRISKPVEFRLTDKKIIVNDEQVIEYKEIIGKGEVVPPVEIEIDSAITDGKTHNFKITPRQESAEFKFIYREKEVTMPIYSDFKIENKKLHIVHNEKPHNLEVLPSEIYSGVYNAIENNPKIVLKSLDLKIENDKPIYDLRVKEPFKLFGFIPMNINSRYVVDPVIGKIVKEERPWYARLGISNPLSQYGQLWQ